MPKALGPIAGSALGAGGLSAWLPTQYAAGDAEHSCPRARGSKVSVPRSEIDPARFNRDLVLPYELRLQDFQLALQDVYDFFYDVNSALAGRGLGRFDDMLRPAAMSGILSDMLTASLAKHSRALTVNGYFNGHPDLIVAGKYPNDSVQAGGDGVEVKTTRKRGGAVDTHGAREQWMCVFVYAVDNETQPAADRAPMEFVEIYLAHVVPDDFRRNPRGELGTRTATLHRDGIRKLREGWVYL
jgi:hypothetical protein